MDGKAHAIEFADGRKATAWCDKVDCGLLMQAYEAMNEIEVELKPYKSKAGKEGLNIVAINHGIKDIIKDPDALQILYDAKQGNTSPNGQYQESVAKEALKRAEESTKYAKEKLTEMPKPEEFGEPDITSINAKSSVKLKKNSKGIGWEIKVVAGEIDLIVGLGREALKLHKAFYEKFPVEE